MEVKSQVVKIVGPVSEDVWAQSFSQNDLFIVIEVRGKEGFLAHETGKRIIFDLNKEYQNLAVKNLATIKEAIEKVTSSPSSAEIEINLVAGAAVGRVLYLVIKGKGMTLVKRNKKVAKVLEGQGAASGLLESGDIIILSSPSFNEVIDFEELKNSFNNHSFEEIGEILAQKIERKEGSFGVAGIVIIFSLAQEEPVISRPSDSFLRRFVFGTRLKRNATSFLEKLRPTDLTERKMTGKRKLLSLALFLIGLLLLTTFLGIKKKTDEKKFSRFEDTYEISLYKIEEAEALLELNPPRAKALLLEIRSDLSPLQKDFKKGSSETKKIEELLNRADFGLGIAAKTYKIDKTPLFLDLNLLKEGARGNDLGLYKDNLVVLDKDKGTTYKISLARKTAEILTGGIRDSKFIAIHGDKTYILANEGVFEVANQKSNIKIEKDREWGEIVSIVAYGGNLYLLDKTHSQIFKYIAGESGFSGRKNYLNFDVKPNLSSGSSMAIDGSIYVITGNDILKFTAGGLDKFTLRGLDQPLNNPSVIYTDDQCKNVYVLDNINQRVVILDKDGLYQAQYQWAELANITDIVVSESEKKILLLSGEKIYQIEIK